jgi:hypothetical protein
MMEDYDNRLKSRE